MQAFLAQRIRLPRRILRICFLAQPAAFTSPFFAGDPPRPTSAKANILTKKRERTPAKGKALSFLQKNDRTVSRVLY